MKVIMTHDYGISSTLISTELSLQKYQIICDPPQDFNAKGENEEPQAVKFLSRNL